MNTEVTATSDFLNNIYLNTNSRKLKTSQLPMEQKSCKDMKM